MHQNKINIQFMAFSSSMPNYCKSRLLGSLFPGSGPVRLVLHHHRRAPGDDRRSLPDDEWIQCGCHYRHHRHYIKSCLCSFPCLLLESSKEAKHSKIIINNVRRWAGRRTTAGTSSSAMTTRRFHWYRWEHVERRVRSGSWFIETFRW